MCNLGKPMHSTRHGSDADNGVYLQHFVGPEEAHVVAATPESDISLPELTSQGLFSMCKYQTRILGYASR
ncbi:hypothetical protein N7475_004516 [Penicillium sp. IBT 31633x]|nr:hypothetical protein N7475_004516 [Penicillium sp. IBT 31633x]